MKTSQSMPLVHVTLETSSAQAWLISIRLLWVHLHVVSNLSMCVPLSALSLSHSSLDLEIALALRALRVLAVVLTLSAMSRVWELEVVLPLADQVEGGEFHLGR